MIFGGFLMVLGVISFFAGVVLGAASVADSVSSIFDLRRDLLVAVPVPGDDEVELEGGSSYTVYAFGQGLVTSEGFDDSSGTDDFDRPELSITGPDGEDVSLDAPLGEFNLTMSDEDAVALYEFEAPATGTYSVVAGDEPTPVDEVGIREGTVTEELVGVFSDLGGNAVAVLIGIVSGAIGTLLLFIGLIWAIVGKGRNKGPTPPPGGWTGGPGWSGPTPGSGVPPGPYGAPGPPRSF